MECAVDSLAGLFQLFDPVHIVPYFAKIVLINIYSALKFPAEFFVHIPVPDRIKIILMQIPEPNWRLLDIRVIRQPAELPVYGRVKEKGSPL